MIAPEGRKEGRGSDLVTSALVALSACVCATGAAAENVEDRWVVADGAAIRWKVAGDTRLPHSDFIEQGGRKAGQKVWYAIATDGSLSVERDVVWPSLRVIPNDTHGSLVRHYGPEASPRITVDGAPLGAVRVREVTLDGTLAFAGVAGALEIRRVTFPAIDVPATVDRWTLRNKGDKPVTIGVPPLRLPQETRGPYGVNMTDATHDAPESTVLQPGGELSFAVVFSGRLPTTAPLVIDGAAEETRRRNFIESLNDSLQLETPDETLNRAFAFAKWRAAESINDTRCGPLLAPGNLRYYAATWCNDNVEYAGPFFPFLGDPGGNAASLNAYRLYLPYMTPSFNPIPSSIVAEGTGTWEGAGDRGDAAMYAYGAARFCLASGDRATATELWKGIAWCLEYCRRRQTAQGVIASDTDELEGRLPAGKANLSTSCLCYGGLRSAACLGRALGKEDEASEYGKRADSLAQAIESCFGASLDGFETYRYYDGNTVLRSWICMPLCMDLLSRKQGTVDALFSPTMWTPDGLASQAGDKVFWDRSTLYAFRGVFQAGESARALDFLARYTRRRLLGDHVPYAVEAFPEGGQGHLASESALYCRIFTEGLFGILPTGFDRFQCTPHLPDGWPRMILRSVRAFGRVFDVAVERAGKRWTLRVVQGGATVTEKSLVPGEMIEVVFPGK